MESAERRRERSAPGVTLNDTENFMPSKTKRNGKAGRGFAPRSVSTRATNELIAKEITERVAKRVQELEGRYGTTASFNMKAAIFDEVLPVLENGVEC